MRIALASYGTRGDVEPTVAVGVELLRRGNEIRIAVPPDLMEFAAAAGLAPVEYGPGIQDQLGRYRDLWTQWAGRFWRIDELWRACAGASRIVTNQWSEMDATLRSLADGVDVLSTSVGYQDVAANVAEYYDIPLVAIHTFPWRANGQLFPRIPAPLVRLGMKTYDWAAWAVTMSAGNTQRRDLGLPKVFGPSPRRIAERGALEIQAYDSACFPGLASEWGGWVERRPFVGTLTMELKTEADNEVSEWLAEGNPPICFCFGSIPVESPDETLRIVDGACAELGERGLVCAAGTDFGDVSDYRNVKVVGAVNYATTFVKCRAVVHHGGAGTTAAVLRAGVPSFVLWSVGDQPFWGAQLTHLKVGASRPLSKVDRTSLVAGLRTVLAPDYALRAREIALRMTKSSDSVTMAADLIEKFANTRHIA
ncbi:glycosyltransferase [Mycolicibacterium smegmatis]|uniref:Putative glycosyl transferase n=1 Tax=Mycolicibacterium smegmatis (strain MKD8) TaxID=1214915 RepID=A0A2U9PI31_MYCSE|nr:glycosyltransferase [Mycolicibacterium smegmatis]AWT51372.1 putative glycosyl transferase [Mycolicibacterium smegmatis MKD8]